MRTATTLLAICVSLLVAMGVVFLSSAVMTADSSLFNKQLVHLGGGILVCGVIACMDYRWFKKLAWPLFGVAVICLLAVLAGGYINGSRRWLSIGPVGFQPSELGKLALIIGMAAFADRHQRKLGTFRYGALYLGGIGAVILGLILLEPAYSTTIVLGSVAGVMMLVAGVRIPHLIVLGCSGLLIVGALIYNTENRMDRIDAFLHPEKYVGGMSDQSEHGTEAVATGRISGIGLGESGHKKRGIVTYHYSDMIFSVIGAEVGLIGSMGIVILYLGFLCSSVFIAWHARDMFGLIVATGVGFFICIQALMHIAVVTSVIPNTGTPLPFISHGGSNLMFNLVGVGLLFSVGRHGLVRVKSKNPFDRHVDVPVAATA